MTLELTIDELCKISVILKREIAKGLSQNDAMIKWLPHFISPPIKISDGLVYVIEIGGSNLRAALVSIKNEKASFVDGPTKTVMPWVRNQSFSKEKFYKMQADELTALKNGHEGLIGYCFSFPTEPLPNKDARLIHWTKGINVPNMIGKEVGKPLLSHINTYYNKDFKKICVINDSIAALFSGLHSGRSDGLIGLIVGTGYNMATFFKSTNISKLIPVSDFNDRIPVNLESGNVSIPYLSKWDEQVDNNSENKGKHLFEKAVSGMYLGRIFKAVFPDSPFDPRKGAKGLVDMLNNPEDIKEEYISIARQIYERSCMLTAASLAGLISILRDHQSVDKICIVAEGGLFWSKINAENSYSNLVKKTLSTLLDELGLYGTEIDFKKIKKATLIGTAIATLS